MVFERMYFCFSLTIIYCRIMYSVILFKIKRGFMYQLKKSITNMWYLLFRSGKSFVCKKPHPGDDRRNAERKV